MRIQVFSHMEFPFNLTVFTYNPYDTEHAFESIGNEIESLRYKSSVLVLMEFASGPPPAEMVAISQERAKQFAGSLGFHLFISGVSDTECVTSVRAAQA